MNGRSTWPAVLLGLFLNAMVLCLPSLLARALGYAIYWELLLWFLVLSGLFCYADLSREFYRTEVSPQGSVWKREQTAWLAQLTGLLVLAIFWMASLAQIRLQNEWQLKPSSILWGSGLLMGGAYLRWSAIASLGTYFVTETVFQAEQSLVERGPYRFMRHPSETGLLLATAGAGILFQSRVAMLIWIAGLLPLVLYRVGLEEAGLRSALGNGYREYQQRVRCLVPFLY